MKVPFISTYFEEKKELKEYKKTLLDRKKKLLRYATLVKSPSLVALTEKQIEIINSELELVQKELKPVKEKKVSTVDWSPIAASVISVVGTVATTKMILNYEEEGYMIPGSLRDVPKKVLNK